RPVPRGRRARRRSRTVGPHARRSGRRSVAGAETEHGPADHAVHQRLLSIGNDDAVREPRPWHDRAARASGGGPGNRGLDATARRRNASSSVRIGSRAACHSPSAHYISGVKKGVIEDTLFGVLKAKREVLVACWSAKIRGAVSTPLTTTELLDKIPAFVDEIIDALDPNAAREPSTSACAGEHGAQRLRLHFDVWEVVREYGLLHECIIELARDGGT